MKKTTKMLLPALFLSVIAISCGNPQNGAVSNGSSGMNQNASEDTSMQTDDMRKSMKVTKAVAVINSNSTDVNGWVTFTKTNDGVRVQAELSGLSDGKHGFHIHTYGDCRADDYSSAGPHFNPADENHGAPADSVRHMGDMGNISTNGTATIDYVDSVININKIIGRALIVHQGTDDLTSQPSGAAGARIACGVIGYANTK